MTTLNGWYCKMKKPDEDPQIRWVTIENFNLLFYENKADKDPVNVFHVDGLQLSNAFGEIEEYHSIKVKISHFCQIPYFYIITPNQFDIKSISKLITSTQQNWKSSLSSSIDNNNNKFNVDEIGKFIFKASDRLTLTVLPDKITVAHKDGKVITMMYNVNFDCYPLNSSEKDKDFKWVVIKYSDQGQKEYRAHCENAEKMMAMINLILRYTQKK